MKNKEHWKPTKAVFDGTKLRFRVNPAGVYAGSVHVSSLQIRRYAELIDKYVRGGHLLDCGCGAVPYYEMYKQKAEHVVCADFKSGPGDHTDVICDLNLQLPFSDDQFDQILLTDVFCHIEKPWKMMPELSRILKPGGKLILATPFHYWMSDYPHQYFHPTDKGLEVLCRDAGLHIIELSSYGGLADIRMDQLNKRMTGKWSNRFFRLLAKYLITTRWYKRTNEKNKYHYSIGFSLVATK